MANIYLRKLDLLARTFGNNMLKFYYRVIDDVFLLACHIGTRTELLVFEQYINSLIPGIHHVQH